jgi:nucleotide-binding universal stress UspA family protein
MNSRHRGKITGKSIGAWTKRDQAGKRMRIHAPAVARRILVPIDFSPKSASAIAFASGIIEKHTGKIILLHVVEFIHYVHDFGYGPVRRHRTNDPAIRRAEVRLRALGRRHFTAGQSWAAMVRSGAICDEIAKTALEMNVEIIVMSTRGLMSAEQVNPENMAARVIRRASCPVLTIRNPPGARNNARNAAHNRVK